MIKAFAGVGLALASLFLSGCTYNTQMEMSSATLGQNQKAVGTVRGEADKNYVFFGIIQTGDDSLENAVRDALSKSSAPAQTISGAFAQRSCTFFLGLLFWSCSTTVFGTAVQYADLGAERIKRVVDAPLGYPDNVTASCAAGERFENGKCITMMPGR